MTTDAGMEERERIARIIDPLWWAEYDRRIALFDRIPMDDDVRLRAFEHERQFCEPSLAQADAILSLRSAPPTTAAPSGREDGSRDSSLLSGSVTVNDPLRDFVLTHYANQDMNHLDFRVAAFEIASAPPSGDRTELPHDQRPIEPQDTQGER